MSEPDELPAWVALARRQRYEVGSRAHEESFARVMSKLEAVRHPSRPSWLAAGALALLVIGWLVVRNEPPISYRVQRWDGDPSVRMLDFSDGTRVALTRGSALDVTALSSRGAALRLRSGHVTLTVTPRKGASWVVQAGPYHVRVTGTAFELDWSEPSQRLAIAMQHGSVVVAGPQIAHGEVSLRTGERLVVFASRAQDDAPAAPEGNSSAASELQDDTEEDQTESTSLSAARPRPIHADRAVPRDWQNHIASGEFETVLREVERIDIAATLNHAPLEDLSAVADAARYTRRTVLARRALLALRRRFPDAPPSRDSAFLLARLLAGNRALEWYERYLEEQPDGVYTSEALGRTMMLMHEAADHVGAARSAARYLARAPRGPYAQAARTIVARSSSATP